MKNLKYILIFIIGFIFLVACGGGSSSANSSGATSQDQGTVQLGNIANATVNVYKLEQNGSKTFLWTKKTTSSTILNKIGKFDLQIDRFDNDSYYILEAKGGEDWDNDDDGALDSMPTANKGTIRAIFKGEEIKRLKNALKITLASELTYRSLDLKNLNPSTLHQDLNSVTKRILSKDIDNNGQIDMQDILVFNPIKDKNAFTKEIDIKKIIKNIHLGNYIPPVHDKQYCYKNQQEITIKIADKNVVIKRVSDNKVLIDTNAKEFYIDNSNGNLDIDYILSPADGGFDINYTIINNTNISQRVPDLIVPGIKLDPQKLDILNSYKLYLEENRTIEDDLAYNNSYNDRLIVAEAHYSYINSNQEEIKYIDDKPYGGTANAAYAPVIVAKDSSFSAGASLIYPFLEYSNPNAISTSDFVSPKNKLYPRMHIVKDSDSWNYLFAFMANYRTSARYDGYIAPNSTYKLNICVRFAPPRYYILTLYPYKYFLSSTYGYTNSPKRDVSPILWTFLSYGGIYSEQDGTNGTPYNPRGWSYDYQEIQEDNNVTIDIKHITEGLSDIMKQKGYNRILIHSLSGNYPVRLGDRLFSQLPNQFVSLAPDYVKKDLSLAFDTIAKNNQKFYLWWGTSANIPVDEQNNTLDFKTWLPDHKIPYTLKNSSHVKYAEYQLNEALKIKPSGIGLDAYVRMDEKEAIARLSMIHQQINSKELDAQIWVEEQQDIKHTQASIVLQRFNGILEKNYIKKPPVLAQYLLPNRQIVVLGELSALDSLQKALGEDDIDPILWKKSYYQTLAKMGYMPVIPHYHRWSKAQDFDGDGGSINDKIRANSDKFLDIKLDSNVIGNSNIYKCFDGIDNDGDGKIDWPYDEGCSSAMDDSE